jgi:hypothetical protein
MSFIFQRDIFNTILTEWIDLKDLVNLDIAVTNKNERKIFLELLSQIPMEIPFGSSSTSSTRVAEKNKIAQKTVKYWKNHKLIIDWLSKRKIYNIRGPGLMITQKIWEGYFPNDLEKAIVLQNKSPEYYLFLDFLSHLRGLTLTNFHDTFPIVQLGGYCPQLRDLKLYNLLYDIVLDEENLPTFSYLNSVYLENVLITSQLLQFFSSTSCQIKKILFKYILFESRFCVLPGPINSIMTKKFLSTIHDLTVVGNIDEFLTKFCYLSINERDDAAAEEDAVDTYDSKADSKSYGKKEKNSTTAFTGGDMKEMLDMKSLSFETTTSPSSPSSPVYSPSSSVYHFRRIHLDSIMKLTSDPICLNSLLKKSPFLKDLIIQRMHLKIFSFLSTLCEWNQKVEILHLNHCQLILEDNPQARYLTSSLCIHSLPFTTLQLSSLVIHFNDKKCLSFFSLLQNNKITTLVISFCSKLTLTTFSQLSRFFPHLQTIIIEEKKEILTFDHVKMLIDCCSSFQNVKIVEWPEWMTEEEKLYRDDHKDVLYERSLAGGMLGWWYERRNENKL